MALSRQDDDATDKIVFIATTGRKDPNRRLDIKVKEQTD